MTRRATYTGVMLALILATGSVQIGANAQTAIEFVDRTDAAGVAHKATITWGSNWADFDSDGDPDLFANRHWLAPRFYENLGGGRYDLRSEKFPSAIGDRFFDRHTCAWGEANGDGEVDLSCAGGADSGTSAVPKQLWIQRGNGFDDRTQELGVSYPKARVRHVNWIDYDGDEDLDLFYLNKLRRGAPNAMFRNDRTGFTRAGVGLEDVIDGLSSTWADWDSDGDPDLFITRYRPGLALAYENVGGSFESVSLPGITNSHWISSAWGDFDGDGLPDLALASDSRVAIYRNSGDSFSVVDSYGLQRGAGTAWLDIEQDGDLDLFVVQARRRGSNRSDFLLIQSGGSFAKLATVSLRGPKAGSGEAVSVADHNRDGRLDLFVTNGAPLHEESSDLKGRWQLFENRTTPGNWIALELQGSDWNPWGFGARVFVDTDGTDYWRELNDGMGLRAQSEVGHLVLGYGDDELIEVRVEWPDGTTDCVTGMSGQTLVVPHGLRPCPPT